MINTGKISSIMSMPKLIARLTFPFLKIKKMSESDWRPVTRSEINSYIEEDVPKLDPAHLQFWLAIRVNPEKWKSHPWGDRGGGFWVVGIYGRNAIWYNDIEDGFNVSQYSKYGSLDEYFCNQDEFYWGILKAYNEIFVPGYSPGKLGPPTPL
jgi:hypothetical protein